MSAKGRAGLKKASTTLQTNVALKALTSFHPDTLVGGQALGFHRPAQSLSCVFY